MATESEKPSLLERLSHFLLREPEDREQLVELLHGAYENSLMDSDSLAMIEGVLQVSEMQVRDIMIPRSQMDVIDITHPPETFIPHVIETAHSRFPVIEDNKNDVIGILLAKDLLRYYAGEDFEVRDMLRPAIFIPEAKRLNVLLKEFRSNRNHIAIVEMNTAELLAWSQLKMCWSKLSVTLKMSTTMTRTKTISSRMLTANLESKP